MNYAVGIDIGGTNTRVALINEAYEVLQREQFATDPLHPAITFQRIADTIAAFGHTDWRILSRAFGSGTWGSLNSAQSSWLASSSSYQGVIHSVSSAGYFRK